MSLDKQAKEKGKIAILDKYSGKKGTMPKHHYHDLFEIYLLERGECKYFIDEESYDVKEGDLILIPAGTIHKTLYEVPEYTRRLIYCPAHFIPTKIVDSLPSILYHYRAPELRQDITDIFDTVEREQEKNDQFSMDIIQNQIHMLFYLIIRNKPARSQKGNMYVSEAISFIKDNYDRDIRLPDIAELYSVSPEHLSRVFKKETGFTFREYLNMIRLQKAETMLKNEPKATVSDIAFRCGFNDSNYFSDKFKKAYGYSPIKAKIK